MAERPTCFVLSPIGKDGSEVRARADTILKHIITPVADECGFEALRADKISEPGMITTQVINHIVNDAMVVADLTGENANVFYELAVRHASQKPYIQIIQKGDRIPFDVAGIRTIEIDHRDLESVANAKTEMARQMRASSTGVPIESPISIAIDFDRLKRSDDPAKRELADILHSITEMKSMMNQVLHDVGFASRAMSRAASFNAVRLGLRSEKAWADILEQLTPRQTKALLQALHDLFQREKHNITGDSSSGPENASGAPSIESGF